MFITLYKFIRSNCSLLLFLVPFPFFIDLYNFEFFVNKIYYEKGEYCSSCKNLSTYSDISWKYIVKKINLPVTLGSILLTIFFMFRLNFKSINKEYVPIFFAFLIIIFFMYISNFTLVNALQNLFFPICLLLIPFIDFRKKDFQYYIYGVSTFSIVHFCSVIYMNDFSFMEIHRNYNWSALFDYQIYSAIVVLPDIYVINLLLLYWAFLLTKNVNIISNLFLIISIIFTIYMGSLSTQRMWFVLTLILILSLIYLLIKNKEIDNKKKYIFLFLLIVHLLIALFTSTNVGQNYVRIFHTFIGLFHLAIKYLGVYFDISEFLKGIVDATSFVKHKDYVIDSTYEVNARLNNMKIITEKLDENMNNNINIFFAGNGHAHSHTHNTILGWIIGMGIIGSSIMFILVSKLFLLINKSFDNNYNKFNTTRYFFVIFILLLLFGSQFNVPTTQVYYLTTLLLTLLSFYNFKKIFM